MSLIGAGMRSHPGVAAKMFRTLADLGINLEMISTSPIKISCMIARDRIPEAVRGAPRGVRARAASPSRNRRCNQAGSSAPVDACVLLSGRPGVDGAELARMDERWVRVLVTAGVWLGVLVVVRWLLGARMAPGSGDTRTPTRRSSPGVGRRSASSAG